MDQPYKITLNDVIGLEKKAPNETSLHNRYHPFDPDQQIEISCLMIDPLNSIGLYYRN